MHPYRYPVYVRLSVCPSVRATVHSLSTRPLDPPLPATVDSYPFQLAEISDAMLTWFRDVWSLLILPAMKMQYKDKGEMMKVKEVRLEAKVVQGPL